VKREKGLA